MKILSKKVDVKINDSIEQILQENVQVCENKPWKQQLAGLIREGELLEKFCYDMGDSYRQQGKTEEARHFYSQGMAYHRVTGIYMKEFIYSKVHDDMQAVREVRE